MKLSPLLALLTAASLYAMPASAAPDLSDSQAYPVLAQAGPTAGSGLYLDRHSIRVADIDGEDMILSADILSPLPDGTAAVKTVTYKLDAAGKEYIRDAGGAWHSLPENSDDPAAVGAMLVRNELGREDRREEFLNEIQQILLRKKEAPQEAPAPSEKDALPASSGEAKEPGAPSVVPTSSVTAKAQVPVKGEKPSQGAEEKEAPPEKGQAPSTEKPAPKEETPAPEEKEKDGPPPAVVVDIQSHEPQVQIEVTKQ